METMTVGRFNKLSKREQALVREKIQSGTLNIVPNKPTRTSGLGDFNPQLQPFSMLDLHPQVASARLQELTTAAETRSALMIAQGNIAQAKFLLDFLNTIGDDPKLKALILSQAQNYLPPGVEKLEDVPAHQQLSVYVRALGDLTIMPEVINIYEREAGKNAKQIAKIHAMISLSRELASSADELPNATSQLANVNTALKRYVPEQRENMQLNALMQRNNAAEGGLILASRVSGLFGGIVGGILAGVAAMPTYAGEAMQPIAERAPISMTGGTLGFISYALINLNKPVFTMEYAGQALVFFAVGAIVAPTAVGVANGLKRIRTQNQQSIL